MTNFLWQYTDAELRGFMSAEKMERLIADRSLEIPRMLLEFRNVVGRRLVEAILDNSGIEVKERKATMEGIPEMIRALAPTEGNFGICGGEGVGKTGYLSVVARRHVTDRISRFIDRQIETKNYSAIDSYLNGCRSVANRKWLLWVNCHVDLVRKRSELFRRETKSAVEDWVTELTDPTTFLVLDNLGGDFRTANDWIGETLARVIEERHRSQAQLIWSSSLTEEKLVDRLSPAIYGKLYSLAKPIFLPRTMPDLRVI